MFIASTASGTKIFHYQQCYQAKKIKDSNCIFFYTATEGREKGYRICNCCALITKYCKKEKRKIDKFVHDHRIKIWLEDGDIYLKTRENYWKIVFNKKAQKIFLLHANNEKYGMWENSNGEKVRKYHDQSDIRCNTITGYMSYVVKHDEWRRVISGEYKDLPQRTKKQKDLYNRTKKRARRRDIGRVLNLIEQLSEKDNYNEVLEG